MKIIHVTASYKPAYIYGGPIQSVAKLCEAMVEVRDGEDLQVLTTTANGTEELEVQTGKVSLIDSVPVTYFKRWTKDHSHFSPKLLIQLRKTILQNQDSKIIIHIHAWWNLVSVLSCLVAKWHKIPVVLSPRGMLTSYSFGNRNSFSKNLIHKFIGKRLLKYCHIHATSEQEKQDILKIITPKSITVISNLVSFPSSAPSLQSSANNIFQLLFLSRIEEKKGLELLFEALTLVDIPWQFTIAGSGKAEYVESLKIKAEKLKLSNRIKWLGLVDKEKKFDLLADHDLTVLTSHNENFANVVIESLSVGTPVLVSKYVGLADYVTDKELGWVTSLKIDEIKTELVSACREVTMREKIRIESPSIIKDDFNDVNLAKKYIELYNRI
ncbi:XrtY-associated glycosyltransferase XYAG1 [Pedobacter roseus]|uniref:Glycosyltransferase n=1 Tax=Pedobacter roseus TaxID=336820 RepID=A0A7G9QI40_9SPHI|nr:glycosyltransferase [Pedobacter roseus]QNN43015.1 glycosyltransferase [Pedobacter roseus]